MVNVWEDAEEAVQADVEGLVQVVFIVAPLALVINI